LVTLKDELVPLWTLILELVEIAPALLTVKFALVPDIIFRELAATAPAAVTAPALVTLKLLFPAEVTFNAVPVTAPAALIVAVGAADGPITKVPVGTLTPAAVTVLGVDNAPAGVIARVLVAPFITVTPPELTTAPVLLTLKLLFVPDIIFKPVPVTPPAALIVAVGVPEDPTTTEPVGTLTPAAVTVLGVESAPAEVMARVLLVPLIIVIPPELVMAPALLTLKVEFVPVPTDTPPNPDMLPPELTRLPVTVALVKVAEPAVRLVIPDKLVFRVAPVEVTLIRLLVPLTRFKAVKPPRLPAILELPVTAIPLEAVNRPLEVTAPELDMLPTLTVPVALMVPVVSPVELRLLVALVELKAKLVLLTLALLVPSVTAKVPVMD
jgi:hypothetical protein